MTYISNYHIIEVPRKAVIAIDSISIGLLLDDEAYGLALMRGLTKIYDGIVISLAKEDLDKSYDIILSDKGITFADDTLRITLSSHPQNRNIDKMTLFKYQGSKSLLDDLLFLLSQKRDNSLCVGRTEDRKVVGFYGRLGGSGTTTIALATAYHLAVTYMIPTIYVNVEPINSAVHYLEIGQKDEMKLLLYLISKGYQVDLHKYIKTDQGYDYFQSSEINFFSIFYFDELKSLLNLLIEKMGYRVIILDLGNGSKSLFDRYDNICDLTYQIIDATCQGQMEGNNNIVFNKAPFDEKSQLGIVIHEDEDGFEYSQNKVSINNYSTFVTEIKEIAMEVAHGFNTDN